MGSLKRVLVALAFAPLFGCASQILQGAQNDCVSYGMEPGTQAYAECVERRFNRRQDRMVAALTPRPVQAADTSSGPTAYLRSQSVSGTSRICVYNRMGSPFIITVGAAEICPITQ